MFLSTNPPTYCTGQILDHMSRISPTLTDGTADQSRLFSKSALVNATTDMACSEIMPIQKVLQIHTAPPRNPILRKCAVVRTSNGPKSFWNIGGWVRVLGSSTSTSTSSPNSLTPNSKKFKSSRTRWVRWWAKVTGATPSARSAPTTECSSCLRHA